MRLLDNLVFIKDCFVSYIFRIRNHYFNENSYIKCVSDSLDNSDYYMRLLALESFKNVSIEFPVDVNSNEYNLGIRKVVINYRDIETKEIFYVLLDVDIKFMYNLLFVDDIPYTALNIVSNEYEPSFFDNLFAPLRRESVEYFLHSLVNVENELDLSSRKSEFCNSGYVVESLEKFVLLYKSNVKMPLSCIYHHFNLGVCLGIFRNAEDNTLENIKFMVEHGLRNYTLLVPAISVTDENLGSLIRYMRENSLFSTGLSLQLYYFANSPFLSKDKYDELKLFFKDIRMENLWIKQ